MTLFYFAGYGSRVDSVTNEVLTIVPSDARGDGAFDLTLDEVRDAVGSDATSPIVIIDAGWTFGSDVAPKARAIKPDPRPRERMRDFSVARSRFPTQIGRCLITSWTMRQEYSTSQRAIEHEGPSAVDEGRQAIHGELTRRLVSALREAPEDLTISGWVDRCRGGVYCSSGEQDHDLVFAPRSDELLTKLLALRMQPVRDAAALLRAWTGRPGGIERGAYFYLGLAHFVAGEHEAAIRALRKARELGSDGGARIADVAYYLGRAYLAPGDDLAAAVSELEAATRADPENGPAHYYLGEAIRNLVLKQTLVRAAAAFERYLECGAPHGHIDEVEAQLEAWRPRTDSGEQGR